MTIVNCEIILLVCTVWYLGFTLGRRWESGSIRDQLRQNGYAESRCGDFKRITIRGTVEEHNT